MNFFRYNIVVATNSVFVYVVSRAGRQVNCRELKFAKSLLDTGVLISPLPDLPPDVFCLMVRIFRLMLVLLCTYIYIYIYIVLIFLQF